MNRRAVIIIALLGAGGALAWWLARDEGPKDDVMALAALDADAALVLVRTGSGEDRRDELRLETGGEAPAWTVPALTLDLGFYLYAQALGDDRVIATQWSPERAITAVLSRADGRVLWETGEYDADRIRLPAERVAGELLLYFEAPGAAGEAALVARKLASGEVAWRFALGEPSALRMWVRSEQVVLHSGGTLRVVSLQGGEEAEAWENTWSACVAEGAIYLGAKEEILRAPLEDLHARAIPLPEGATGGAVVFECGTRAGRDVLLLQGDSTLLLGAFDGAWRWTLALEGRPERLGPRYDGDSSVLGAPGLPRFAPLQVNDSAHRGGFRYLMVDLDEGRVLWRSPPRRGLYAMTSLREGRYFLHVGTGLAFTLDGDSGQVAGGVFSSLWSRDFGLATDRAMFYRSGHAWLTDDSGRARRVDMTQPLAGAVGGLVPGAERAKVALGLTDELPGATLLDGLVGEVEGLAWTRGGGELVAGDSEGRVLAWPMAEAPGQPRTVLARHPARYATTNAIAASEGGGVVLTWNGSAGDGGDYAYWLDRYDAEGKLLGRTRLPSQGLTLALSPDGAWAATGVDEGAVFVELAAGTVKARFDAMMYPDVAWLDTARVAVVQTDLDIVRASSATSARTTDFGEDRMPTLAAAAEDGTHATLHEGIRLYDSAGDEQRRIEIPERAIALALSKDGSRVAVGWGDGRVRVWKTADGALVKEATWPGEVKHLALHPRGEVVAVGDKMGLVGVIRL